MCICMYVFVQKKNIWRMHEYMLYPPRLYTTDIVAISFYRIFYSMLNNSKELACMKI